MVKPNDCKTKYLSLTFSSYKIFRLFIERINWKIGNLFSSKQNQGNRRLKIYFEKLDNDDQPLEHDQLNHLGSNIDFFELYIKNVINNQYYSHFIHYDENEPEWNVIKVQFVCHGLNIYDDIGCPSRIISPSSQDVRRPVLRNEVVRSNISLQDFSTEISMKDEKRPIHLQLFILVILFVLLILIICSIFLYKMIIRKRKGEADLSNCSSIPSLSDDVQRNDHECSSCRLNAKPYQVSRVPSPHIDSLYKEVQRRL